MRHLDSVPNARTPPRAAHTGASSSNGAKRSEGSCAAHNLRKGGTPCTRPTTELTLSIRLPVFFKHFIYLIRIILSYKIDNTPDNDITNHENDCKNH